MPTIAEKIQRFKMNLLRKMPFYGDIMMHLEFVENKSIPTAATNGKTIWYNSDFFSTLSDGEMHFIIMHEFLHVLLRHGTRNINTNRDNGIWNVACDIIVNDMLKWIKNDIQASGIAFATPSIGIFSNINRDETAENLYSRIVADNANRDKNSSKIRIRNVYRDYSTSLKIDETDITNDIKPFSENTEEMELNDRWIREMILQSSQRNAGSMKSYYVPRGIYSFTETQKLNWKRLLQDFLTQEIDDESSYTTPERKYLHMDLILPGHSLTEEKLDEIWAFIDSSGSISKKELEQFLTQLHRIIKEFKCNLNICYWNTSVTDVYKKIRYNDNILKYIPLHSGGTDINCVYNWIESNKVKPDVMLILTDGYFGKLETPAFKRQLGKKTILVLSSNIAIDNNMKLIGKIAKL